MCQQTPECLKIYILSNCNLNIYFVHLHVECECEHVYQEFTVKCVNFTVNKELHNVSLKAVGISRRKTLAYFQITVCCVLPF
jgi:hypothetical protein